MVLVLVVILGAVLLLAGYVWSARRGRGVDSGKLYALRVRDSRKVTGRNPGGGVGPH